MTLDDLCQEITDRMGSVRVAFSVRGQAYDQQLDWVGFSARNGAICGTLRLVNWDNNEIVDIKEQELFLVDATACQNPSRVLAWASAYDRAMPRIVPKKASKAKYPEYLMPHDYRDDAWKLKRPMTEKDFDAVMARRYP